MSHPLWRLMAVAMAFVAGLYNLPSHGRASGPYQLPTVAQLTFTLPPNFILPTTSDFNCLARTDYPGSGVSIPIRGVCYNAEAPSQPPPPPPPYASPVTHIEVTGIVDASGHLFVALVPCAYIDSPPTALRIWLDAQLSKSAGPVSGTVTVRENTGPNVEEVFCADGVEASGPAKITPLSLSHDGDVDTNGQVAGDGCTTFDELGPDYASGGLNDPFNPNDCSVVIDRVGLYEISHELAGGYRRCMGAVEDGPLQMRVYCYTDIAGITINPEGYPGVYGDGLPGAPPPGPEALRTCPTTCGPDPGSGNLVYGDVEGTHTVLAGSYNAGTNEVTFTGCFEDADGQDPLGDIYVQWDWNVQTGAGTSQMWTGQCSSAGSPDTGTLQALKLATTAQMDACYDVAGVCPYADNDPPSYDRNGDGVIDDNDAGDGVPDHRELGDDTVCGRRDPFNINDYYDVSIPRDGAITLFGDILLVIGNFDASGYAPDEPAAEGPGLKVNYDRPVPMTGAAGGWNRGSPNYKIDLFVDVLGVIGQFKPGGCPGSG